MPLVARTDSADAEKGDYGKDLVVTGVRDVPDAAAALTANIANVEISPEENKRLLRKIDFNILPLLCCVYFIQFLDKTALSYASIMGIREDNNLSLSQYSWLSSIFYIAYLVGEWPTNYCLQRLPLAKYTGANIVAWGIVLACTAVTHNYAGLVAVRFLLGLFEACITPSFSLVTSQWYRKREQGFRTGIWFSFNAFANVIGAFIAWGFAKHDAAGDFSIPGWKILFIFLGGVTIVLGIAAAMPKATTQRKGSSLKHDPLAVQLRSGELDDAGVLSAPGKRQKEKRHQQEETALDAKVTQKVLAMAREQQDELAALGLGDAEDPDLPAGLRATADDEGDEDDGAFSDEDAYEEYEELEIDETDDALLDSYVPAGHLEPGRSLADLIMEKIERAGEQPASAPAPVAAPPEDSGFNPKVVDVYSKVGQLLSRYKSGPLPKAFKILPTLPMWPQLIMLTNPETWTPHATYAATRIFASNLDPKQSQKYYKEILLEKVREEIGETGKLSVHTYMALKKAMYKPAAFFKGLLFPLCESGTCTLREAAILGSVLTKVSVPVLHSGAALLKLAEMEYTGPNSLFIRVLLDKKYALPYKVVDALVFHFLRFKRDQRQMPVLWHQAFLVFAQRYKADLTPEQKDALLEVLRFQTHHQITPEIRRELQHSVTRGEDELSANMTMEVEIQ